MIESFLITGRETLEASLVVGITLAYLSRAGKKQYMLTVLYSIAAAILASLLAAMLFIRLAGGFEGRAEMLFEGTTLLIGAALLTMMILWMMRQRQHRKDIERKVEKHLARSSVLTHAGIFLLVFTAVLREGVETVIFLGAASYAGGVSLAGGLLGVLAAAILGYLFFRGARKVNLKKLFMISSVLLIMFAAGLATRGVRELEEARTLPAFVSPLYDTGHVVSEESVLGAFLKGFFGYNPRPSLLETIVYLVYLATMGILLMRMIGTKKTEKSISA